MQPDTPRLHEGGIHVLHNERVLVDGLQVIGVSYADSSYPSPPALIS